MRSLVQKIEWFNIKNQVECDVLIIGAGPAAACVASRLYDFKVICIEQGTHTSQLNYPTNFMNWEHLKQTKFNPDPNIRRSIYDYPINNSESAISIANFNGVGGSTILFSGQYPRFHPSDFMVNSIDGVAVDWPIGYADLEPYYELDSTVTPVAGCVGDPVYPVIKNLLPPVPLGKMGFKLADAFENLGWHWWPSYSAIATQDSVKNVPCSNVGACNTGCPIGAKGSADVSYWPKNIAMGTQLITESRVTQIKLKSKRIASGVSYVTLNGQEKFIHAQIIVLAANGVGTPRIMLNSKSSEYPEGIANSSGLVGKNLMLHPLGYVEGLFSEDLESNEGPQGCCITSHEFYESDPKRGFSRGYSLQILRGPGPVEAANSGILRRKVNWGKQFHEDFEKRYNKTAHIAVMTEDLPDPNNRVVLDEKLKDRVGMPSPKIIYQLSDNTKKMLAHGVNRSKEVMNKAGAIDTQSYAPVRNTGWHLMGTACMGNDPSASVVNKECQTHDIENLFIADSSVFVTSAGVNPAATINAIGLRTGDEIRKRLVR